jgi:DNA-binding XRE family transcriptional regulator
MKVERQFAANLLACRKRAGLSQETLGFRTSLHRTEIGLLEREALERDIRYALQNG